MANITELIKNIRNAIYGKDVRESIAGAIEKCYEDASENGNANMEVTEARGTFSTLNNRLNNSDSVKANRTELETTKSNLQTQINSLASGSPLVASSVSEMTDTTRVYVNTTDGHWYTYNGTSWVDGGVYQATENSNTVNNINEGINSQYENENTAFIKNEAFSIDSSYFEQGAISYSGKELDSTTRIRSKLINLSLYDYLRVNNINSNYQYICFVYDKDFNILTYVDWNSAYKLLERESNYYYVRFVIRKVDDSDITITEFDNIEFDITLNSPLRNRINNLENNAIQSLEIPISGSDVTSMSNKVFRKNGIWLFPISQMIDKPSNVTGSVILQTIGFKNSADNNTKTLYQQFLTSNSLQKVFLRSFYIDEEESVEILRDWTILVEQTSLPFIPGSPKNKWYVLGDSISAGYYSMKTADLGDLTPAITYDDGTCSVWDNTLSHSYWGYINKWYLNRELINLAIPGQGYLHKANYDSQNLIDVIKNNDFSDAGLITVAMGFNDWHYNINRGNHDLISEDIPIPDDDFDTSQITTVNQAIWFCLGALIKKAPGAKIVIQTPMNGWRYGGDFDSNWGIGHNLEKSNKLSDIHDDIIFWCDYYGLQYIDLTYNNSIVNRVNIKDVLIDGSHPSDEAHQQLARSVWKQIGY